MHCNTSLLYKVSITSYPSNAPVYLGVGVNTIVEKDVCGSIYQRSLKRPGHMLSAIVAHCTYMGCELTLSYTYFVVSLMWFFAEL